LIAALKKPLSAEVIFRDRNSSFYPLLVNPEKWETSPMEFLDTKKPFWIRMPRNGNCPYTGLSKTKLYSIIGKPASTVRSAVLKDEAQSKGTRLIHLQSLLDYIETCEVNIGKDD